MENNYNQRAAQFLRSLLSWFRLQNLAVFLLSCGVLLLLGFILFAPSTAAAAESVRRAQVKAGLIYKFIPFINWPEAVLPDKVGESGIEGDQFIIGIMENTAMVEAFAPVVGTLVKGHKLVVKKLVVDTSEVDLQRCHIIYLGDSLEDKVGAIMSRLDGHPVVTVSSMEDFVEHGGIIAFKEDKLRIRFTINIRAARQNEIMFRAKLLRVANYVIGVEDGPE